MKQQTTKFQQPAVDYTDEEEFIEYDDVSDGMDIQKAVIK